ncbi:hypothetical protein C0991_007110 [Blastosporella zonata]|nr:hypothetical protein C0991_007110 [Blastosporella zonata]
MAVVSSLVIEVCVDSVQSAINAVQGGADRLELCANLGVGGGTTPSLGLLKSVQREVDGLPIMAMIRPRTGDFLYSDQELQVMLEDIHVFKEQGVRGIVVGILDKDARVDVERMKLFVVLLITVSLWFTGASIELSMRLFHLKVTIRQTISSSIGSDLNSVCFHRAFDMTRDADEALRDIESIGGISRILTSGQGKRALEALSTLASLFRTTKELNGDERWGLTILPGSGVNATTVAPILDALLPLGLQEIHLSGSRWFQGGMRFKREGMGMGIGGDGDWGVWMVDGEKVSEVRNIADERWDAYRAGDGEE